MLKKLIAAAAFVALGTVGSYAADMAPRYAKAPMGAPSWSWTGLYVGVNAGGGLQNTIIDDKNCDLSCSSLNMSRGFGTVGGTVGYNYQFGPAVVGIEGDFNWSSYRTTLTDPDWNNFGSLHTTKSDWFSTVRGRFGLAVDRVMVYATGGVAFVDRNVTGNDIPGTCSSNCFAIRETSVGVVGGVGAEYAFLPNWSMKGEYLYISTPTARAQDPNGSASDQFAATDNIQVVRLGLNYRFGS